jgi:hypothetical protein
MVTSQKGLGPEKDYAGEDQQYAKRQTRHLVREGAPEKQARCLVIASPIELFQRLCITSPKATLNVYGTVLILFRKHCQQFLNNYKNVYLMSETHYPCAGRGGPWSCDRLRIPHFQTFGS